MTRPDTNQDVEVRLSEISCRRAACIAQIGEPSGRTLRHRRHQCRRVRADGSADQHGAEARVCAVTSRFRVVPAAYVVFRRGDEVLLQLRQNTGYRDGYWATAAAGHVEQDESVFEAAVREAVEELGVVIAVADLVPLCGMHRTQGNHDPIDERADFFFEVRRWSGEPRIMEPVKNAELRWCPLGDLPHNVVPHELFVLEHLFAGDLAAVVTHGF
jgi:8-oxo-dGTP diphosphatase